MRLRRLFGWDHPVVGCAAADEALLVIIDVGVGRGSERCLLVVGSVSRERFFDFGSSIIFGRISHYEHWMYQ